MEHAINSALIGGDDIEIIVVDDGSSDNTLKIANEYQEKYPNIVRAIHQENAGHGGAVNTGIQNAKGVYFKVLDSDDWLDAFSLQQVLLLLRNMITDGVGLDMVISNYVYEKPSVHKHKVINYNLAIPKDRVIGWKDLRHFRISQNLLMHSIIYRTKLLRDCGFELPEHTFYVDNLFAYVPLPYVKKMYYLDVNLYRYFIGRDDQSVNETVMTERIDQQLKVNKLMIDAYDLMTIKDFKLRKYMIKYLAMMMIVSSALLINEGSAESLKKRDDLWNYLRNKNIIIYNIINRRKLGKVMQMKKKSGQKIIIQGYHFFNRIYGFN
jgi:glycosyltransferase involved in cell wall biosynthesis